MTDPNRRSVGYDRRMVDMRATQQLLEHVAMRAEFVDVHAGSLDADETHQEATKILEAITELRRRGDTVVRGADVQLVATAAFRWLDEYRGLELGADDELAHAIERLENAIGGG